MASSLAQWTLAVSGDVDAGPITAREADPAAEVSEA